MFLDPETAARQQLLPEENDDISPVRCDLLGRLASQQPWGGRFHTSLLTSLPAPLPIERCRARAPIALSWLYHEHAAAAREEGELKRGKARRVEEREGEERGGAGESEEVDRRSGQGGHQDGGERKGEGGGKDMWARYDGVAMTLLGAYRYNLPANERLWTTLLLEAPRLPGGVWEGMRDDLADEGEGGRRTLALATARELLLHRDACHQQASKKRPNMRMICVMKVGTK